MKNVWRCITIGSIVLYASLPLFQARFIPTHDGEYNIIRIHEFESMLKAGYIAPRWAPSLNSGYGVPMFNFLYPFPNYIGVFFHSIGRNLADSFKLSLAVGFVVATAACYFWLKKLFQYEHAIIGTILFSLVPYWFVDIYIRGSLGEVIAIAWLMLALASIEHGWKRMTALTIAGMIISHNILALIFSPLLIVYMFIRQKPLTPFFWGLGLSSYFWLPALAERSFVVGLNTVNFLDHFPELSQMLIPSWGTGFSGPEHSFNQMSFQIGIAPLVLCVISAFCVLNEKNQVQRKLAVFFLLSALTSAVLMLRFSTAVWKAMPLLPYVQFPWRFLSFYLPVVGFLGAYCSTRIHNRFVVYGFVVLSLLLVVFYMRPVTYAPRDDMYYLTKPEFTDGTASLGNSFSTRWSNWKSKRAAEAVEVEKGEAVISRLKAKPGQYEFTVTSSTLATVRINALFYPGWQVYVNGNRLPFDVQEDGIIRFPIATGQIRVSAVFGETPLRWLSDWISFLSLSWLMGSAILEQYARRDRRFASVQRP